MRQFPKMQVYSLRIRNTKKSVIKPVWPWKDDFQNLEPYVNLCKKIAKYELVCPKEVPKN